MVALLDLSPSVPPGPGPVDLLNAVRDPFCVHPPHFVAMLVVRLHPNPKKAFCIGLWSVGEPAPRAWTTGLCCCACKPRDRNQLFEIDVNVIKLKPEQKDLIHDFVAKLLFLGKRARPDLKTAISFLSTRVREPDTEDYKKLIRLMKCLKSTKKIPLNFGADNSGCIRWWVDASFSVHPDMKSHSGAMMSMGQGAAISGSKKQKLNTKNLDGVVAHWSGRLHANDYMGQIFLWSTRLHCE